MRMLGNARSERSAAVISFVIEVNALRTESADVISHSYVRMSLGPEAGASLYPAARSSSRLDASKGAYRIAIRAPSARSFLPM